MFCVEENWLPEQEASDSVTVGCFINPLEPKQTQVELLTGSDKAQHSPSPVCMEPRPPMHSLPLLSTDLAPVTGSIEEVVYSSILMSAKLMKCFKPPAILRRYKEELQSFKALPGQGNQEGVFEENI
jgi:hypothetical protein